MLMKMLLLFLILNLFGCETNHERMKLENEIQSVVDIDWRNSVPLKELTGAKNQCVKTPYLKNCDIVDNYLQDISISLATCQANQRSSLCQSVVNTISKNPIAPILPKAEALQLPSSPFYFNLPTKLLEAQSNNAAYRHEITILWLEEWRVSIIFHAVILVLAMLFVFSSFQNKNENSQLKISLKESQAARNSAVDSLNGRLQLEQQEKNKKSAKEREDAERKAHQEWNEYQLYKQQKMIESLEKDATQEFANQKPDASSIDTTTLLSAAFNLKPTKE